MQFITLGININNIGKDPVTATLEEFTPPQTNIIGLTPHIIILPKQKGIIVTGLINIEPYEGKIQDFCATVKLTSVKPNIKPTFKSACLGVDIKPNSASIDDLSSSNNANVNLGCTESWSCSRWGLCTTVQTRKCVDVNQCGTNNNRPQETISCIGPNFETNAVNGRYGVDGVTITVNGINYGYAGGATFKCSSADASIIMNTPEGIPICSRKGYPISERVYVQNSQVGTFLFKS